MRSPLHCVYRHHRCTDPYSPVPAHLSATSLCWSQSKLRPAFLHCLSIEHWTSLLITTIPVKVNRWLLGSQTFSHASRVSEFKSSVCVHQRAHVNVRRLVGIGSLLPPCGWSQIVGVGASAFIYWNISPAQDWEFVLFISLSSKVHFQPLFKLL